MAKKEADDKDPKAKKPKEPRTPKEPKEAKAPKEPRADEGKGTAPKEGAEGGSEVPKDYRPRLQTKYLSEIRAELGQALGLTNIHAIPKLVKIVINMGVGDAVQDKKN